MTAQIIFTICLHFAIISMVNMFDKILNFRKISKVQLFPFTRLFVCLFFFYFSMFEENICSDLRSILDGKKKRLLIKRFLFHIQLIDWQGLVIRNEQP